MSRASADTSRTNVRTTVALPIRAWRAARVSVHVLGGIATQTFVFPRVTTERRRAITRQWCGRLLELMNVEARVHGTIDARRGNLLIVANHISWLDIFVLNAQHASLFVAKSELADWPVAGRLIRGAGTLFIERARRRDTERVNRCAADALKAGDAIVVFPEGTTTDGLSLLPFKTSMLRVLEPAPPGVMVQPVLLEYGAVSEEIGWVGTESGVDNAKRMMARAGSFPVKVHFLEPFQPGDFPGRKAIAAESRRRIEEALVAVLGHPLRPFAYDVAPVAYAAPDRGAIAPPP